MRKIKKYFIPHKENDYLPHFFRTGTLVVLVLILGGLSLFLARVSVFVSRTDYLAAIYPKLLETLANESRVGASGEKTLSINPLLEEAARFKAEDMAKNGYFAHTSPDGKTPWYWFDKANYVFKYAGENLAINFTDSEETHKAWLASELHRANIMNEKFSEIGVGMAKGTYQGRPTVFVVELFGTPADQPFPVEVKKRLEAAAPATPPEELAVAIPEVGPKVLAETATAEPLPKISWWERALASPRTFTDRLYLSLAALALILIGIAVLAEIRLHHVSIWIIGFILVLSILFILFLNNYFYFVPSMIL